MKRSISILVVLLLLFSLISTTLPAHADGSSLFRGVGTKDDPFLISTPEDLLMLADAVNTGTSFDGMYFLQTQNINLEGVNWVSIGLYDSDNSFCGTYDGNGHYVENLTVNVGGNNGFFGKLGGTVMNFGIESGEITGTCVGAITSHSSRSSAKIINCYNKATVRGARAGGIADNFNGTILNCWSDCELIASADSKVGGIVSYGAAYIKHCYSLRQYDIGTLVEPDGCSTIDLQASSPEQFVDTMNKNIYDVAITANLSASDLNIWNIGENNSIRLSTDSYSFNIFHIPIYFMSNLIYIVPTVLTFLALILLISSARRKSSK